MSLKRTKNKQDKERIDHDKGKKVDQYMNDWDSSECGKNANDVIDAIVQALYVAERDSSMPSAIYEDENALAEKLSPANTIKEQFSQQDINDMAKLLRRGY